MLGLMEKQKIVQGLQRVPGLVQSHRGILGVIICFAYVSSLNP
jgi:hypothetical protein